MGAGDYPAGDGPAGDDPITTTSTAARYPAGGSIQWSLTEKDCPTVNGNPRSGSSIDYRMAVGLGFRRGSLPGAPEIGHDLQKVDLAQEDSRIQQDVEYAVNNANPVKTLLSAGDVAIISVTWARAAWGGLLVNTQYSNLRTRKAGRVSSNG